MMRVGRAACAGLTLLLGACAPSAPTDGATRAASAPGSLRIEQGWLVDDAGRVVILHGVNFINKLPPYLPSALGFGADDADFIVAQGWNTVRMGPIHKALAPQPGVYDDAYLDDLAATVRLLTDRGVFVLLDFHQDLFNERYQGEGLADWATVDSAPVDPATTPNCALGFPGNMFTCQFLWEAFDRFFGFNGRTPEVGPRGRTLQDEYAEAWRHVARRFRDQPKVFGYDLWNEPHPGSALAPCLNPAIGCPGDLDAKLTAFHARVAAAIRTVDPDTTIWYEPFGTNFNAGMPTAHGDLGTSQVGFSFHVYACPSSVMPPEAGTLPGEVTQACGPLGEERVYVNAGAQAAKYGHAPLVTEFGASDDYATIDRMADLADAHRTGWQYWAWWNEDPCCERPAEGIIDHPSNPPTAEHLDQAKLDVLVRPFPRAVAGTPQRWSWDEAAKRFELAYATQGVARLRPGVVTEIWLPRRHFPDGYLATVTGARVTSPPNAEALHLLAERNAPEVSLTVTKK